MSDDKKIKPGKPMDVRDHPSRSVPEATQSYWGEYPKGLKQYPVGDMGTETRSASNDVSKSPKDDSVTNPGDINTEPYSGPINLYRGAPFEHDN